MSYLRNPLKEITREDIGRVLWDDMADLPLAQKIGLIQSWHYLDDQLNFDGRGGVLVPEWWEREQHIAFDKVKADPRMKASYIWDLLKGREYVEEALRVAKAVDVAEEVERRRSA